MVSNRFLLITVLCLVTTGSIVYGFASHLLRPWIRRHFPGALLAIASYTLGVLLVFPLFVIDVALLLLFFRATTLLEVVIIISIAWFMAFGSFGAGDVAGHHFLPDKPSGEG